MDTSEVVEALRDTDFISGLFVILVDRGFGTLPARETAISVLELMLKELARHPDWKDRALGDYELARLFRISPRKVRGYLDEISYRDTSRSDESLRKELKHVLRTAQPGTDGTYVVFEIDDGLLRDYARRLVRANYGVFELGVSSSVAKVPGHQFSVLCGSLLTQAEQSKVASKIESVLGSVTAKQFESKSLLRTALESFVESAGSEAGKKGVELGFALLTGGWTSVVSSVKGLAERIRGE